MTPQAWIALSALSFTVFLSVIGLVIWLVRLEGKTTSTADACRATAEALAAHAKAQALLASAHHDAVGDAKLEIVRVQEQIKHLTNLVERWLVPARTRRALSEQQT